MWIKEFIRGSAIFSIFSLDRKWVMYEDKIKALDPDFF